MQIVAVQFPLRDTLLGACSEQLVDLRKYLQTPYASSVLQRQHDSV